jgi:hypothetical protein
MKWHFWAGKESSVRELLRSNDPVRVSWVQALLAEAGIDVDVFDAHAAILEGSASAIMRRLVVGDDDYSRARRLLIEVGEIVPGAGGW